MDGPFHISVHRFQGDLDFNDETAAKHMKGWVPALLPTGLDVRRG